MQTRKRGTLFNNAVFKHLEFEEPLKQLYKSDAEDIKTHLHLPGHHS